MSQPLLQLKDVVAFYGDFQALFGVSFEVRPNEVLAILGGNGAGKTTCLRVVSGLLRPRSGTVHFEGKDITQTAPDSIVDLGIAHVPEGRQLFPEMSVEENLYLGSQLPGRGRTGRRTSSGCTRCSRGSASGSGSSRAPSPAASSRWWPSAAP